jgi:hypothetical protein
VCSWDVKLELRPLMESTVVLDDDCLNVGQGPFGARRIYLIESGTFKFVGSEFGHYSGNVLPCSADFATYGPNAESDDLKVDVRAVLHVKGGNQEKPERYIYVSHSTIVSLSLQARTTLHGNGTVKFQDSKFLVRPQFEVGVLKDHDDADWKRLMRLNRAMIIGHAELTKNTIAYQFWEVVNPTAPAEGG